MKILNLLSELRGANVSLFVDADGVIYLHGINIGPNDVEFNFVDIPQENYEPLIKAIIMLQNNGFFFNKSLTVNG